LQQLKGQVFPEFLFNGVSTELYITIYLLKLLQLTWNERKFKVDDVNGNYWIVSDRMYELKQIGEYKMRLDLQEMR